MHLITLINRSLHVITLINLLLHLLTLINRLMHLTTLINRLMRLITRINRLLHLITLINQICHKFLSATYRSVHDNTPSTSLIFSKSTTLLAFSDQHLDLSLMFPGPGIPRQSGTASEPSDMSLPPSGMSLNAIVYVHLRWCV